jgi:hypothetical protein
LATAGLGQLVKENIRDKEGLLVRDNVHGVDVFADDPNVRIIHISASGTVLAGAEPFISNLSTFLDEAVLLSQQAKDVVLLLNYALMRPEPVAQIVFSVSAVEMLGQQEKWSADQTRLLAKLAGDAQNAAIGNEAERAEVAAAISRGTQKVGLRQGVMRLLDTLQLVHLKKEWDKLYSERSTLVHGLAPKPGADYSDLAFRTVSLCGQILLKVLEKEIAAAGAHIDKYYKS